MDKYHHVIEQYKNGNFTMESWNLPFQISRSCEVGITDNEASANLENRTMYAGLN